MNYEPRGPQLEGISRLVEKAFAGLFWDPGRGKTITVLQAYKILRDEGLVRNMLVTASTNIVDDVWPHEIEKFDDLDVSYSLMRGDGNKRIEGWNMDADVYLINYENLYWMMETFGTRPGFDMLVVDESSKFRNGRLRRRRKKKSKRPTRNAFAALLKMLPGFKRRYILTGTPIPKGYLNLWPQMYIVDQGESLGTTITGFKNNYFIPSGYKGYDHVLRPGAEVEIQNAIAPRIHRAERDNKVPIEFFDLTVRLPMKARRVYDDLEREFIAEWKGKTLLAANAAVATSKLRQAANGAIYHDRKKNWLPLHERKVTALADLMDELQGQPLLIGFEFEHDYNMMRKFGLKIPRYVGSRAAKADLKKDWDEGRLPGLCGQISSLSHGMNFQYGGKNVLAYGLTFDLDDYEQFYQRVWRDGQEEGVIMYNLVAEDTVDDVMLEVLAGRSRNQRALLNALKRRYHL
jgi:hypothetical protein